MNFDSQALISILKKHALPLAVGGVGIILILIGIVSLVFSNKKEGVIFEDGVATTSAVLTSEIFVDVSGAVVAPGVYKLKADSRVWDALVLAGGLSAAADREWASKNLNLAAKLSDGGKIYIPAKGTTGGTGTTSTTGSSPRDTRDTFDTRGTLININTASLSQLDKLPGIGPVTAQKIIDGRPYSAIEELRTRKIVGEKVFNQIKDSISVY